ncbi:NUDIX domain-containing protein [Paenibacillus lautus]|uniref:NUDIX domain-containing protein n=1 Tax=Paenibacillus TaxID=44249 RepID=UPI001C1281AC|nr:NUDIX domain-containing protein [Paenibacillus lautus]MBU5349147.1 NUDIX domain-containing protein [Paenibacillus lautus]
MTIQPKTVGVYLFINGLFAFAFGPNRHEGKLGIARFGGHIEANESIVECALREVKEETTLDVLLVSSPITYQIDSWDSRLMEVEDEGKEVKPILRFGQNVMFFARSNLEPKPWSETKGIILLSETELLRICNSEVTYGDFIAWGGSRIVRNEYSKDYILQPLGQMRFLARLMQERPDILKNVYC